MSSYNYVPIGTKAVNIDSYVIPTNGLDFKYQVDVLDAQMGVLVNRYTDGVLDTKDSNLPAYYSTDANGNPIGIFNPKDGSIISLGSSSFTVTTPQKLLENPTSAASHGTVTGSGASTSYEVIDGKNVVSVTTGVGINAVLNFKTFTASILPDGRITFALYVPQMSNLSGLTFEVSDVVGFTGNVYKCQVSNSAAFNFNGWYNICIKPPAEGEWNDLGAIGVNLDRRWEVQAGTAGTGAAKFTADITGNTLTVTGSPTGTVLSVGQTINAPYVRAGTKISALGTGTGGVGTYTVDGAAQTVASEAMTASSTLSFDKTMFTNLRVTIGTQAGVACKVSFAEVELNQRNSTSQCSITVDDGFLETYTTTAPIAESYGFKINMAIIASTIGTGSYMTVAQISDLVKRGHTACPHGVTTLDTLGTIPAMLAEIQSNQAPIIANGWNVDDSAYCYIVPNGIWAQGSGATADDSLIKSAILQAGIIGIRGSGFAPIIYNEFTKKVALPWIPEVGHRADLTSDALESLNVQRVILNIKQAAREGRNFTLTFHKVIPSTNGAAQTNNIEIQIQNFKLIMDALKAEKDAGRLSVVSFPQNIKTIRNLT